MKSRYFQLGGLTRRFLWHLLSLLLPLFVSIPASCETDIAYLQNELAGFQNIVFDVRGSRGGNGDVASAYLTALDFIERLKYPHKITFVVDDSAKKILTVLTGQRFQGSDIHTIDNKPILLSTSHDLIAHGSHVD